ncbi:MAG: replication initiation protein [Rectinemataceae bacterium]
MNESEEAVESRDPDAELLSALRSLPAAERKLVMLVYSKARFGDAELRSYSFTSTDLSDSLMLRGEGTDERLGDICRKLSKRPVALPRGDGGWFLASWFSSIERDPSADCYIFRVQPLLKRLVLDLRKRSLLAPLDAYMRLEGKYSHRIFEMLLEGRPKGKSRSYWEIEVPIDTLRTAFELNDRYKKAKALKKWVVMGAVTEINLADIGMRVEVETVLQGKKTKGFLFMIRQRGEKPGNGDRIGQNDRRQ